MSSCMCATWPTPDSAAQRADVVAVLEGMEKDGTLDGDWRGRTIEVLNKADLLGGVAHVPFREGAVPLSAVTGEGLPALLARIDERIGAGMEQAVYSIPPDDGARIAWLYQHGEVLARADGDDAIRLRVRLLPVDRARFEHLA